jgi:hypothetical protein
VAKNDPTIVLILAMVKVRVQLAVANPDVSQAIDTNDVFSILLSDHPNPEIDLLLPT